MPSLSLAQPPEKSSLRASPWQKPVLKALAPAPVVTLSLYLPSPLVSKRIVSPLSLVWAPKPKNPEI